ncbi:MAG TPA: HAMP domain-containing protein [Actinophytocola sp.]|uniref:HAMP domain-containing protein n=1 Tax=Actinophytocola sp. TaxID=1872138 RepID=UPI002DDD8F64|nr:HAMP domain-containing protein [Actinophytocola sp.]HEV2784118.1 HAMP domain-containing protein [Actinophytocola sp.]
MTALESAGGTAGLGGSVREDIEGLLEELVDATTRVRRGSFDVRLARRSGLAGQVVDGFNAMVDLQERRNRDLLRISRVVGREGRMLERLDEEEFDGAWARGAAAVNSLIDDLARPTAEIARVIAAVAEGDLSQHMALEIEGRPLRGEFNRIGRIVNTMVDQLSSFADEVTRVAREVGTEGQLGGQADVRGVSGTWRALTDSVNTMASNLTNQVRSISLTATAIAQGDLSRKITVSARGEIAELAETINSLTDTLRVFADEVTRVAREVGTEGRLGGQARVPNVAGTWKDLTDAVNQLAANLTDQVRNIAQVTTAVARGDLSQKITVDARGEIVALKDTVNTMVDQLSSFADEVTRVAREVGTEGRLGGQAQVEGVSGTWRDLTESVNQLAGNLTSQVRNIAQVTTAVAQGDLSQKITVDAQGEILALKNTVNTMVDQLSSFADEVTRVAREVGTEGQLGGQAQVKGVAGTWRDLTENVNQLASTLTIQLRAIAGVSTAVTRGDLTQQIGVQASGEVAELKDNINQMIVALRETTKENADQSWLDSNLARIGGLLQGQRDLTDVCQMIMNEVVPLVNGQIGAFFLRFGDGEAPAEWRLCGSYGLGLVHQPHSFARGEGLVGQAAEAKQLILLRDTEANFTPIRSGVGSFAPTALVVLPVLFEDETLGVLEIGSVSAFSNLHLTFLERLVVTIGVAINTIQANRRTEELLEQSQRLAVELQNQSAELQRTNAELEDKATLLSEQNRNIEIKNLEIEAARRRVEENAQQLAQASQYKSEFLANMSHELRTPLNSLLLLARLLADNPEHNLTDKQIEFANTIHNAGSDLLALIDDILDLSKIEAGRVSVELTSVDLAALAGGAERAFRAQAEEKGLELRVHVAEDAPAIIITDTQRLQQILRNLLSNAVKFTDRGTVTLTVETAPPGRTFGVPALDTADRVVAFAVADTGIGIEDAKFAMIFEAFQQADGTTSRRYGGTGLGLSISKELARLLGGAITVESRLGIGSTFTLYIPETMPDDGGSIPMRSLPLAETDTGLPPLTTGTPILRPAAPEPSERKHQLEGVTVLIVDDDVRNVFALTSALELHGMTVLYADNGADGVRLLTDHPEVDIILMDAMMPNLDGNETTRMIRTLPRSADVPIVFLTAKAMPEDRESSLAAGADDYITKPVDLDQLLDVIASWAAQSRTRRGVPDDTEVRP